MEKMLYYFAPMEGVTGATYRAAHHRYFPGVNKYYMPFITPTQHQALTPRQLRDIAPERNAGVPAVPQLLTRRAEDFIWCADALAGLGYGEVNLNLGCPSGTVVAKGKGAGFLAFPDELDRFLDAVFRAARCEISIKTRLGVDDPAEFARLLSIYNRYPVSELTVHARVRRDFYKGGVRAEGFAEALAGSRCPVALNGDLVTAADLRDARTRYPGARALMLGRGLIANPALVTRETGGPGPERDTLRAFHDEVYEGYSALFGDRRNAARRMKELWFYHIHLFGEHEKHEKRLRKATEPREYEAAAAAIFRELPLRADAAPGWFRSA